jgi:small subunit ribosomal protein S6
LIARLLQITIRATFRSSYVVPTTFDGQTQGKETISYMNREYELGVIIPISVQEAEVKTVLETIEGWIKDFGGEITNVDNWGRRRLAYPIQEFREGYYIFIAMNFPTQRIGELEYNLKFSDQIIRHLVIRLDED